MTIPLAAAGIRAVLFDAVGTLIYPQPSVAVAYTAAGRHCGSCRGADEVAARFRAAFGASERARRTQNVWHTSEAAERRLWREIVDQVFDDVADRGPLFAALWEHFARPQHWALYDDVAVAWQALAGAGFELALASNFDSRLHAVCEGLPPLDRCARRYVSSEVGFRKPGPAFFRAVERSLELEPRQILLVGDDWENDVLGGSRAGWRVAWLDRGGPAHLGPAPHGPQPAGAVRLGGLAELRDLRL